MPRRVALFITCLTDQFYPRVGIAVTRVLEKLGCVVEFPVEQTCCGQPFYNNGFTAEARKLAERFITVFEKYDQVVTPSGSCCAMVREQFQELLHDDPAWAPRMEKVRASTFEFTEYLCNELKVDLSAWRLPQMQSITYHYTCHQRGLGLTDEGIRLLKQLGNVDFRPLEKSDQCCGFGGTFALKYPAISQAIVQDKALCIAATQAQTTLCNDAGCSMNIAGMVHRAGVKTQVKHLAEVIAEAMGLNLDSF